MSASPMTEVVRRIRRTVLLGDGAGMTDGRLLERFLSDGDNLAFAALMRRHGPMVWGVCRRILSSHHDAEDAFQATFLVLVRRASSVVPREMVGNWLYGVAHQTALKARSLAAKRTRREKPLVETTDAAVAEQSSWCELRPVLDLEVRGLPDKYRAPLVLCDMEGKTRKEAAVQLGVPEGTVAGRLARARGYLAQRLRRRGLEVSAGALAAMVSQNAASATVPAALLSSTAQAASALMAGQAISAISPAVQTLIQGVLKSMFLTKLKTPALFAVVFGIIGLGGGMITRSWAIPTAPELPVASSSFLFELEHADLTQTQRQPKDGNTIGAKLDSVDADKSSIKVTISNRTTGQATKTLQVAKDAKILRDGKDTKLADLKPGARAILKLTADQSTVLALSIEGAAVQATLKSVDGSKNTITVTMDSARKGKQDKTFQVAKDAKVTLAGKETRLSDIPVGTGLMLRSLADDPGTLILIQSPPKRGRE